MPPAKGPRNPRALRELRNIGGKGIAYDNAERALALAKLKSARVPMLA
jgi:hypothetical protein